MVNYFLMFLMLQFINPSFVLKHLNLQINVNYLHKYIIKLKQYFYIILELILLLNIVFF